MSAKRWKYSHWRCPYAMNRGVYRRIAAEMGTDSMTLAKGVGGVFCVTGSVAVGTTRDSQDTTERESIIRAYLARRADFTREFANSTKRSICFSKPRMTLVRKTSAFRTPKIAPPDRVNMPVGHENTRHVDRAVRPSVNPSRPLGTNRCTKARMLGRRMNRILSW